MSFTGGIPTSGQSLGVTRDPIRNNFSAINTTIAVNHVAMNLADQGKHKFLQMPIQVSGPATAATGEGAIYTTEVSAAGPVQFNFKRENNGAELGLLIAKGSTSVANNVVTVLTSLVGANFPNQFIALVEAHIVTKLAEFRTFAFLYCFSSSNLCDIGYPVDSSGQAIMNFGTASNSRISIGGSGNTNLMCRVNVTGSPSTVNWSITQFIFPPS